MTGFHIIFRHRCKAAVAFIGLAFGAHSAWAQFEGGPGDGFALAATITAQLPTGMAAGGNGRGDVRTALSVSGMPSDIFSGGVGRGDVTLAISTTPLASSIFAGGDGRGDAMTPFTLPADLLVGARVFLEGAMADMFSMRHDLRDAGFVPLVEPYSGLGFPQVGSGGEQTTPFVLSPMANNAVVDWIHVQLRSANDPETVIATRNGLLMTNGFIMDVDGFSPLTFPGIPAGSYFVAVMHRNHLGVMTASPYQPFSGTLNIDFSQPYIMTYGTESRKYVYPNMLMWAGDANNDGWLKYVGDFNDRDPILVSIGGSVPTASTTGYKLEDINLDGEVKYVGDGNDRDPILVNIGGSVPTNTRQEQLP